MFDYFASFPARDRRRSLRRATWFDTVNRSSILKPVIWPENAPRQRPHRSSRPISEAMPSRKNPSKPIQTETTMQYKTLVLQLLRGQFPEIHNRLKAARTLLPTIDLYSRELKTSHEIWKDFLSERKPGSDPSQIASESLEIALQELEDRLPSELPPEGSEPLTLDAAMAYLKARAGSE